MTYGDFKDLTRRTASDKIWRNKAFNIAKNSIAYKFSDKKTSGRTVKNENTSNK